MIDLQLDTSEGRLAAKLSGELDADNAPTFLQRMIAVHQPPADLMLGVEDLEFIDSSGIGAFLKLRGRVIDGGGSFVVCDPKPSIRRTFDIAGVLDAFGLC